TQGRSHAGLLRVMRTAIGGESGQRHDARRGRIPPVPIPIQMMNDKVRLSATDQTATVTPDRGGTQLAPLRCRAPRRTRPVVARLAMALVVARLHKMRCLGARRRPARP